MVALSLRALLVMVMAAAVLCGCGNDDDTADGGDTVDSGGDSGGDIGGDVGDTGAGGDTGEAMTTLSGVTRSMAEIEVQVPGARICVVSVDGATDDRCVMSSEDGSWSIGDIPEGANVELRITAADHEIYRCWQIADPSRNEDRTINLIHSNLPTLMLFGLESAVDPSSGHLVVEVGTDGVRSEDGSYGPMPGVTVSLTPVSGEGPYYLGDTLDPTLTETADEGIALIFNVDPGDYTVTLEGVPDGCWSHSDADLAREGLQARVSAKEITQVEMVCP